MQKLIIVGDLTTDEIANNKQHFRYKILLTVSEKQWRKKREAKLLLMHFEPLLACNRACVLLSCMLICIVFLFNFNFVVAVLMAVWFVAVSFHKFLAFM